MAHTLPKEFRFIPGPVPKVWGFIATVSDDVLDASDFPEEGVTLYKDFTKNLAGRVANYGQYIYTGPGEAPPGYSAFYFGPINQNLDDPQRTTSDFGNHPWPEVLYRIDWYPDRSFPIATPNTDGTNLGMTIGNRYYERRLRKPSANEGTLFLTYEYFNALQFDIPQHPTPITTEIQWEFLGQRGSVDCLHPKIIIPAKQSATQSYYSAGNISEIGYAADQVFPATNFEDWAPYCIHDQQDFVNIGWHRKVVFVNPPQSPDLIKSR